MKKEKRVGKLGKDKGKGPEKRSLNSRLRLKMVKTAHIVLRTRPKKNQQKAIPGDWMQKRKETISNRTADPWGAKGLSHKS